MIIEYLLPDARIMMNITCACCYSWNVYKTSCHAAVMNTFTHVVSVPEFSGRLILKCLYGNMQTMNKYS